MESMETFGRSDHKPKPKAEVFEGIIEVMTKLTFTDGESVSLEAPHIGLHGGDYAKVSAELDAYVKDMKSQIKLKLAQRGEPKS